MLRSILQILGCLIIFIVARNILRAVFAPPRDAVTPRPQGPPDSTPTVGELRKDPVCGTYVSTGASITRTVRGETLYFCSPECRDKFSAS
jgi:YHS domain-containing protein